MQIALIAHDRMKDAMVSLAGEFAATLRRHALVATGTTGGRPRREVGLDVECMLSGPLGETCRSAPGSPRAACRPWSSCATR
jgi:methylglyoxal synthase